MFQKLITLSLIKLNEHYSILRKYFAELKNFFLLLYHINPNIHNIYYLGKRKNKDFPKQIDGKT